MYRGWIKLYRCLLDDVLWQCGTNEQKVILVTLLLMANHAERKWQWQGKPHLCRPGQMITSLKNIQQKCGQRISIPQIRRAIKRFEEMGFLVNTAAKDHRLITICHWERYQQSEVPGDTPPVKIVSDACQDDGKIAAPNKNAKKEKKGKKQGPLSFEQMDMQTAQAAANAAKAEFLGD